MPEALKEKKGMQHSQRRSGLKAQRRNRGLRTREGVKLAGGRRTATSLGKQPPHLVVGTRSDAYRKVTV